MTTVTDAVILESKDIWKAFQEWRMSDGNYRKVRFIVPINDLNGNATDRIAVPSDIHTVVKSYREALDQSQFRLALRMTEHISGSLDFEIVAHYPRLRMTP